MICSENQKEYIENETANVTFAITEVRGDGTEAEEVDEPIRPTR